jgi:hypothetical protein
MPWGKKAEVGKLPGPRGVPGLVQNFLVTKGKMDSDLVGILKAVVRSRPGEEKAFNIRIFDESEAVVKKIQVKDYDSLNEHPDLIIYEGWFNEAAKQVELEEKKAMPSTIILTEAEIQQKIEALSEPGSTVFFYQARGPAQGGPLGRGCAVIELNPNYPEKKGKKYIIYTADVIDMQPVGKGQKLFDSNKSKDVARWIKEAHHKRLY